MIKHAFITKLSMDEITERFHLCFIQSNEQSNKHIYKGNHFNGLTTDRHFSFSIYESILRGTNRYLLKGSLQQIDETFHVTWAIKRNKIHLLILLLILALVIITVLQTAFTDRFYIGIITAVIAIIPFFILLSRGKSERQALKEKLGEIFLCNVDEPTIQMASNVKKSPIKIFLRKRKVPVLIVAGIIVLLIILNIETIFNIPLVVFIKTQIADTEGLDVIPVVKKIEVIPETDKRYRITTDDLSFISPWGKENDITTLTNVNSYRFDKEKWVTIIKYETLNLMSETDVQKINKNYNKKIESYYDLQKLTLMVTPSDLKITKSINEITYLGHLLIMKSIIPTSEEIYNFENSETEGFVFIRKYDNNETFWIELFPLNDKFGYNFVFKNVAEKDVFLILGSLTFIKK